MATVLDAFLAASMEVITSLIQLTLHYITSRIVSTHGVQGLACDVLRPPFKAIDAHEVAKAIGMQHPMEEVCCGVKDGYGSNVRGPCKQGLT